MLRGEKCNKSASSRPVSLEERDMHPRISAHCPPDHPRSGLINQKLAIGDWDLGRDPSLEAPLEPQDAERGGPRQPRGCVGQVNTRIYSLV